MMNRLWFILSFAMSSSVVAATQEEVIKVLSKFDPVLSLNVSHDANYEIEIKNTSDNDLKIKEILSGCSCLEITEFPKTLQTGKSAKFKVKVSEKRVGLIDIPFYIFLEGGKQPIIANQPLLILPSNGLFFPKKVIFAKDSKYAFIQVLGTNSSISNLTYSCKNTAVSGKLLIKKQYAKSSQVQSLIYRFSLTEKTSRPVFANLNFKSGKSFNNVIVRWSSSEP